MTDELVTLAEAAATNLVGAAATDTWAGVRASFRKHFERDGDHKHLDETAAKLEAVPPAELQAIRAQPQRDWTRLPTPEA